MVHSVVSPCFSFKIYHYRRRAVKTLLVCQGLMSQMSLKYATNDEVYSSQIIFSGIYESDISVRYG